MAILLQWLSYCFTGKLFRTRLKISWNIVGRRPLLKTGMVLLGILVHREHLFRLCLEIKVLPDSLLTVGTLLKPLGTL